MNAATAAMNTLGDPRAANMSSARRLVNITDKNIARSISARSRVWSSAVVGSRRKRARRPAAGITPHPITSRKPRAMAHLRPSVRGGGAGRVVERWAKDQRVTAACIVTAVGSLTRVPIRYANREQATLLEGHFEVTSLVGTLSEAGTHLHITVADGEGRTYGGHLVLSSPSRRWHTVSLWHRSRGSRKHESPEIGALRGASDGNRTHDLWYHKPAL
jgi:predicted DNA-binding protein with PD1-like motif